MPIPFSEFARSIKAETAFTVLAVAKRLIAEGKDVIELEIGDSPFPTPDVAVEAGTKAIRDGHTRYAPSMGHPELRTAAAEYVRAPVAEPLAALALVRERGVVDEEALRGGRS